MVRSRTEQRMKLEKKKKKEMLQIHQENSYVREERGLLFGSFWI